MTRLAAPEDTDSKLLVASEAVFWTTFHFKRGNMEVLHFHSIKACECGNAMGNLLAVKIATTHRRSLPNVE